jgi:two-component system CheB/CheR fusion protein
VADQDDSLDVLRSRARRALARGELTPDDLGFDEASDASRLLENLRIHQAELEIQNAELMESRERAEAERARYQLLYESLPLPALVLDRMGVIGEANQAAVDFFGFPASGHLRRHSVFRLFGDRGLGWFGPALDRATRDQLPVLTERVPMLNADGETVPMDCLVLNLESRYRADQHSLLLFIDRTQEQERDRERALNRSLLRNSDALIYAFDLDGRCLLMNHAAGKAFGIDEREAVGRSRDECMGEERSRRETMADRRALYQRQPLLEEQTWSLEGQGDRILAMTRFVLRDERDAPVGVAVIATDLTRHRRMQARLELATEIFSRGSEAILITDVDHRVTFANGAAERMSGFAESELMGRNPREFLSQRHDDRFLQRIAEQINADGFWEGEVWLNRQDGGVYPGWLRISRVQSRLDSALHHVLVLRDISQEKMADEEIERLAFFDTLTGTANRYLLRDRTARAVKAAAREKGQFAFAFMDLDRFKEINDAYGHEAGDQILVQVAGRLTDSALDRDTVCRLGGDEFIVLLEGVDREAAGERLNEMLRSISVPFEIDGQSHQISASVGIAMYPDDGKAYEDLLKNADTALNDAKSGGRNLCRFFRADMADAASSLAQLDAAMRQALKVDGFHLVYQPQISLATGECLGLEALLRWQPEGQAPIPPSKFIPIAEQSGLIVELGAWVLDHVLRQIRDWSGHPLDGVPVSINVAAEQFWLDGFVDDLSDRLRASGVAPDSVVLELTERTAMKMPTQSAEILRALAQQGIELSLDDFGTGYSSLAGLKRFPLTYLKIDRSFVTDLVHDPDDQAICRAVIQLAHTMGMQVIAEGVETEEQERFLREAGCDLAQGFLYSPGLKPEDLSAWLAGRSLTTA